MHKRLLSVCLLFATTLAATAHAQESVVTATLPPTMTPSWTKGIQPINQENYWNAVACGKQGGQRPLCVFYDADLCQNADFDFAMYTPYKKVAFEVWQAVRAKQAPPTPSYPEAQRTRITIKLTPKPAARNPLTGIQIKRGGKVLQPISQFMDAGGGNYTYDCPTFAATSSITIDMIGKSRTVACRIPQPVLALMR